MFLVLKLRKLYLQTTFMKKSKHLKWLSLNEQFAAIRQNKVYFSSASGIWLFPALRLNNSDVSRPRNFYSNLRQVINPRTYFLSANTPNLMRIKIIIYFDKWATRTFSPISLLHSEYLILLKKIQLIFASKAYLPEYTRFRHINS